MCTHEKRRYVIHPIEDIKIANEKDWTARRRREPIQAEEQDGYPTRCI